MNDDTQVLVVDDDTGIREGCCRVLRKAGYEVHSAGDGKSADDLFVRNKNFAAAVIDLQLPGMDGIELTRRMHAVDPDCVLLMMTAFASIETAVQAIKQGAYGYISKPFTPDELLLQLTNGLKKRELTLESRSLKKEREKSLLEIAQERSRCSTIIKCMADGVIVANTDRKIVLRNAAASRIFEMYRADHPQEASCTEPGSVPLPCPVSALPCAELIGLIESVFKTEEEPVIISKEVVVGEGTYMVNVSPVTEGDGTKCGVVAVLRDITARKKLETAKSMFVSMVSHEIQSPLAVAEGYLNIILNDTVAADEAQQREMINRSYLRVRALREMVSELMNLSAIDTGNFVIKRSFININEVVRCAVECMHEKAKDGKIDLFFESTNGRGSENGPVVRVFADKNAMFIVLKNIIENAVKYTPTGGSVRIAVEENGLYARIRVRDSGYGIKPDEKCKIFDEFYRSKGKLTAGIPGTGLGLCLVKKLLELQEGSVSVESVYGKGSEFTVCVPIER
ncbi:MAG: response regulator [Spirochaetes bacterium]|nr:response regulator [Spirochaetota bacterium]